MGLWLMNSKDSHSTTTSCLCGFECIARSRSATGAITVDGGTACAAGISKDLQCHQSIGQSEDKATDGLVEGLLLCRKYLLERLIT
jgi:hypothetical protein